MDLKERYRKILFDLYFSEEFKPNIPYSLILEDRLGKVSYGSEFVGTRKKFFVSDVDGVLNKKNTPSLFECYLKNHLNSEVRKNSERLCEIARKIGEATRSNEKLKIVNSVKELEDELKSYGVSKEEHLISCINAARKLKLAHNLIEIFHKVRRMDYKIILNSGSPEDCLDFLVRVKGLPVDMFFGSKWYFKNGKFFSIEPNLSSKKIEVMERALESEKDLFGKSIFITDDLKADREVSLALGMAIKLGEGKIEHPFCIECKDVKDVVDKVKRWEMLHIHYFMREPSLELKILRKIKDLKKFFENEEKENFVKTANEISDLIFFGYRRAKIKKKIFEVEKASKKIKDRMSKILIEIGNFEPLMKIENLEFFERELEEIVEEMERKGIGWKMMLNIM